MMEDVSLEDLGQRLRRGADSEEGPLAVALPALSAHILLPYEEAVPLMRTGVEMLQAAHDVALLEFGVFGVALTLGCGVGGKWWCFHCAIWRRVSLAFLLTPFIGDHRIPVRRYDRSQHKLAKSAGYDVARALAEFLPAFPYIGS